jgi:hypothetical protein
MKDNKLPIRAIQYRSWERRNVVRPGRRWLVEYLDLKEALAT